MFAIPIVTPWKLAVAMGAEVTVFSTSPSKEEEAKKKLGAQHFVLSNNEESLKVKKDNFGCNTV